MRMTMNRENEFKSYIYYYCNSIDGIIDDRIENEIPENDILDEFMDIFDSEFEDDAEGSRTFVEILLGRVNPPKEVTDAELEEHKLSCEEIDMLRDEFENYIRTYLEI